MKTVHRWGLVIVLALATIAGARAIKSPKSNATQLPLVMRLAQEEDIDAVMELYENMTPMDKKSLIIFPGNHQRRLVLNSIQNKHLFIALSQEKKALAVVKIFLITKQEVLQNILRKELRILPWEEPTAPILREARFLHMRSDNIANFSFSVDRIATQRLVTPAETDWDVKKITSIYCGSCFTRDTYRGNGIASQLEAFSFAAIRRQLIEHTQQYGISQICLLFGKVQAMYMHQGLIRSFMTMITETPQFIHNQDCISLFAWSFLTTLPKFELAATGELVETKISIEEWQDYGCAFVYDVL